MHSIDEVLTICVAALLLSSVGCTAESSPGRAPKSADPTNTQPLQAALGGVVMCQERYRATHGTYAQQGCERVANHPDVQVHVEWANADGWGGRSTKPGVRGDCVYVMGWATEPQYLFTSLDHRGADGQGASCDSGTLAAPKSWSEYVQGLFESQLMTLSRRMKHYRARHGTFALGDSMPLFSDSARHVRYLWVGATGYAVEATTPAFPGVSCVIWEGELRGQAPPTTKGQRSSPTAGVVVCDDFAASLRGDA